MKPNITAIAASILIASASTPASAETVGTIKSPDGKLTLTIDTENGTVGYTLSKGAQILIERSAVGIATSEGDFTSGVTIDGMETAKINNTFTLPAASCNRIDDICNQATITLVNGDDVAKTVFRLYNDGMAFRYEIPGTGNITVSDESSECRIAGQGRIFNLPLCQGVNASFAEADTELMECMKTARLPLVSQSGDTHILVAETAPNGNYCGSRLEVAGGAYHFTPLETVSATMPLKTPWRMILAGTQQQLAQTSMPLCLADPTTLTDTGWIRPGLAAWSFGGEDHTPQGFNMETIKKYIDWAASQHWQYFTLDKNWSRNGISLKEVTSYANSKNIGVFIWVSRHSLPTNETDLNKQLQDWKNAGVKGLKVEFWEHDTQESARLRQLFLQLTARKHMHVVLANSGNTAGLERTWPHLLATDNTLTNSAYAFNPDCVTAAHNINTAIFRAPLGLTDYCPVDFADHNGKLHQATTHAHQLALAVVMHGGLTNIGDAPANLRYSMAKEILKTIPATWSDTRCLAAEAEEFISLLRTDGSNRWLAALTSEKRTAEIPLDFLNDGERVNAYIYRDGSCPTDLAFSYRERLTRADKLSIEMADNGGFLVKLSASENEVKPYCIKYEAEATANTIPFGVSVLDDPDRLCSGGSYVSGAGNNRPVTINNITVPKTGTYAVTVYYMADEASNGFLKLNGSFASIRALNFINSGGQTGRSLAQATVSLPFDRTGGNSIEINSSDPLPSIDRITVTDNESLVSGVENVATDSPVPGHIYSLNGNVVIEQPTAATYTIHNTLGRLLASGSMDAGAVSIPLSEHGIVIVTLTCGTNRFATKVVVK